MTDPDPDDPTTPPKSPRGCWLVAGFFLTGAVGFAGAVVAGVGFNAPPGVVGAVMFGTPALYVVVLCLLAIRHMRTPGVAADLTPEQRAAAPVVTSLMSAFLLVGVVSIGGVILVQLLGAPFWVTPIVFFAPPVMLAVFAWPHLRTLPRRLKRAAPSPEKAAASVTTPRLPTELTTEPTDPNDFPTVPAGGTPPGSHLAHRLADADLGAGCACLGVLGAAAFWNGIVGVFVWQAVQGLRRGNPEWFLVVFLIPFVLVGLVLVAVAVAAAGVWVVSLLVGKVVVEVDAHPLVPGGRYRGHVAQGGPHRLTKVGVELACEEAATYTSGTTESTDKKVVATQLAELPEPLPAAPLDFEFVVPAGAMHSFAAEKNRITWKLTVWGRVLGVLPYQRSFEVVVRPGAEHG
ncbi:hypothetical protein J0H58_04165 [bacterium]|nr:hypothetical protein [bacterium]